MRRRWVYINGEAIEVNTDYTPVRIAPDVLPDIQPYKSMATGEMITSRSKHREHLKATGCVEIGNDSSLFRGPQPIPDVAPQQRKEIIRAQVDAMTHTQFRAAIKRDVDRIKWNSRKD